MTATATDPYGHGLSALARPEEAAYGYAADLLDPQEDEYASDPSQWIKERLDKHLTVQQDEICQSVAENRYTAVPSAHDLGKSFIASGIAAHWIDAHPLGEAFVVTTATTDAQVKAILWKEIGRRHREGGLRGRITLDAKWMISYGTGVEELAGMGRKPADYDPTAFQGIHERFVLVIIDEAGGVPRAIFEAVDTLVTNENARVLAIGNPDDPGAHFSRICQPGSGWNVVHLDGLESANFTAEEVSRFPELRKHMIREGIKPSTERVPDRLRPLLLSPRWVAERIPRWGVGSPMWESKVRGRFPRVSVDTLIHPAWVTKAHNRELPQEATDPRMGVDVARYGLDHSIIALRQGGHVRIIDDIPKGPTTELVGHVQNHGWGRPLTPIANVDDTGVGGGVTDMLVENGYPVLPLIAGSRASDLDLLPTGVPRFADARSEWWWHMREALMGPSGTGDDGWIDLDPDDEDLAAQLMAVKYIINSKGQIRIESKDDMKKRGMPSPDRADAVVYTLVRETVEDIVRMEDSMTGDLMDENVW